MVLVIDTWLECPQLFQKILFSVPSNKKIFGVYLCRLIYKNIKNWYHFKRLMVVMEYRLSLDNFTKANGKKYPWEDT